MTDTKNLSQNTGCKTWSEYTLDEINENKKKVCIECHYFCVAKSSKSVYWNDSSCDYLKIEKHSRGCLPTECVEKGIFKEKGKKKRSSIRIKKPWYQ